MNKKQPEDVDGSIKLAERWNELINESDEKYFSDLAHQNNKKIPTLELDLEELEQGENEDIIGYVFDEPMESIDVLRGLVKDMGFEDLFVVVKNNCAYVDADMKSIRQLTSDDIGKLVVFKGLVRNSTGAIPKLKLATFDCGNTGCSTRFSITQNDEEVNLSGARCPQCKLEVEECKFRDDKSMFVDFMKCDIEEDPEGLRGKQPERMTCEISGPLTSYEKRLGVGDRVTIMGIYRTRKKDKKSLVYEPYIQVLGFFKRGKNYEDLKISPEEEARFIEMSKDKNLLLKMAKAVAPNINGHDVEKSAIVLQMFGGNQYSTDRRGDIHILLIGDPGVGKSMMVRNISGVAPHVVKASGAPTTSVGLTACVRKDEDSAGGFVLEAGAAVLADGGLLIIDEFDKMDKEVRGALHEIMEDQVCSVSKANINTVLRTKCAVLAIMNPKRNRFNSEETISEQIDLPPSLLSRFDLIFAIRDIPSETKDRKICEAILRSRQGNTVETEYEVEDITRYIIYAKSRIRNINFSDEAIKLLTDKFIEIRALSGKDTISITSRQMEGLSRLAEGCAKARLSELVEGEDARMAIALLDYYLNTMCINPDTGKPEADKTTGTRTSTQMKSALDIKNLIKDYYNELQYKDTNYIDFNKLKNKYNEVFGDGKFDVRFGAFMNDELGTTTNSGNCVVLKGEWFKELQHKKKESLKDDEGKDI